MMRSRMYLNQARALWKQREGATIIEFAIVAPILFFMIFALLEFGLILFSMVVIESATATVSRVARTGFDGGAANREQFIRQLIDRKSAGLINASRIIITTDLTSPPDTLVDEPEECCPGGTCPGGVPVPPVGTCPPGFPFEDRNNNGVYDGVAASLNAGDTGEIVRYRVVYRWPLQFPGSSLFFGGPDFYIESNAFVQNEAF